MAEKKTEAAPTEAEIAAAQAVMQRAAEAKQREAADRIKPISDIVGSPEFEAVCDMVNGVDPAFMADMNIGPHLMALRTGLQGLAIAAPPMREIAAVPAPAEPTPPAS